jgi:non-ribosomal peptide synthetase-like protein
VPRSDRALLATLSNPETAPAVRPQLLHAIVEEQADARADAVALQFGNEATTYGHLDRRANRIARYLRRQGVKRGSVVAMLLPRSTDAFVAIVGILKAGAAYVPIDPEYPADRISYIIDNSCADGLVTTGELARSHGEFRGAIVRVDTDRAAINAESGLRLAQTEVGLAPRDLCYIVYTSGSTGRPKGVMVEHRNAWSLVHAEADIYGVGPEDRVYQGASLSFDLSVEEVWAAFRAGATLVPATKEMGCAGPDLSRMLAQQRITVLSTVPTLLSMLAADVPTLRLLILGGEVCHEHIVARWARPGLRILNTYGPTETTVIATYANLEPGKPVTIGRAVPGYRVDLLDEELRVVPPGEIGEICIGGAGVARGYVGLPNETSARFVPDPFASGGDPDVRMYRTGDLGRLDSEGNIQFMGRRDGQVKLRGFRVELGEIESALLQADGFVAAACVVREDVPGMQQLVAYVVPGAGGALPEDRTREYLRGRLPAYMVPALIETVHELPRLPTGKIDRASLPPPRPRELRPEAAERRPQTDTERLIYGVWEALFAPQRVSTADDFFLDLGGHSLLAARMVSELRKHPRFARASVLDVYEHPTITRLAAALDTAVSGADRPGFAARNAAPGRRTRVRHVVAGSVQTALLYVVCAFRVPQWITPYLVYFLLQAQGHSVVASVAWAVACAIAVFPALIVAAVVAKWLVLGRVRPGRYPLWGAYYVRWWFVRTLINSLPLAYLTGTPLLPFVYRLLGARVGRNVHLRSDRLGAFDVISIGDGTSIEEEASLLGYTVEDEELVIGSVHVGRDCFLGERTVLCDDTVIEDGGRLEDLSLLPRGGRIGERESWSGSPARRVAGLPAPVSAPVHGRLRRGATVALYTALVVLLPIVLLFAIVPGLFLLTRLDPLAQPLAYVAATPLVGASFVILMTAEVALLKWLLVGRVRPGRYPVDGWFYIRNWVVDQLLALALGSVGQLHATLYLAPWYRALGAKLGRFVELSTASSTTPDLLEMEDESTVADEVTLGEARVDRGWMTVAPTRLGRRAFVGNSAVVPAGTTLGDGSLVGVLSIAPSAPGEAARDDASWLGSPPLLLPRRQPSAAFSEQRTFRPTARLRRARASFEILRVTLPPAGFILVTATVTTSTVVLWEALGAAGTLLLLPAIYGACCAAVAVAVALAKWVVMGRYRPFVHPLWSLFVWRLELANALYEFLAAPLALSALQGTPLLPGYLRLLGARIGGRTYMETTGFLEWDLVEIGDRAALNSDCVVQTHLFEDRVLKASRLRIGADCVVGTQSVVLYDSEMEDGARLDALSLLMKGETLRADTAWAGIPASWRFALADDDRARRSAA